MSQTKARLEKLRGRMAASGVDLVAIGPTANMRYFLGFAPHPDERLCLLLVTDQEATIVVPAVNAERVAAGTDLPLVRWADEAGPVQAVHQALHGGRPVRCLAADGAMRADFLLPLLAEAAPTHTIPADGLIAPLRQRKTADEIEALARAAAQADQAMAAGMDVCRPGVTEAEVAWAVETAFRRSGAQQVDFAIIASGPNGAYPHHESGSRPLAPGDAIILDIGATLDGYKSDITRMVCLGEPGAEIERAYAAVLAANEAGRSAVKPGITAGDVDRATREVLEHADYGEQFVHRTGHGLGLDGHEPPWISAGNPALLEEGMVFSVEPGVYLPGKFGIRIEDIVAVTETGARLLTGFDHGLVVK